MLGFNIPTFKIMDVLSFEAEYWDHDFANSYTNVYYEGLPPNPVLYSESGHDQKYGGPWYWSVYAQKTILENLTFKLQFARDHTVIETSLTGRSTGDPQEAMDGRGNWSWMFKIEFGF